MTILPTNWLQIIQDFKNNLDLTKVENIPLNKTIDFILKEKDNALEDRFAQITVNYIFKNTEHPFYYMDTLPLDIVKSIFDEVKPNIVGINFYIKMNSCMAEALAFNRLIENGFAFQGKVPHQQIEDDFYLANEEGSHAFEVKYKLVESYLHEAVENKIRAKMYFTDYKKYINLKLVQLEQKDIDKVDGFISKILNNTSVLDIHFPNKSCFQIQQKEYCKSFNPDIIINTISNFRTQEHSIDYKSTGFHIKLDIRDNMEIQSIQSIFIKRRVTPSYQNVKNEFRVYLERKLKKIKVQKNKQIKIVTRGNDKFGGFIYLPIPWNWEWSKIDIKKSFSKLISKLIDSLNIDFSVYIYLHQFENKEMLIMLKKRKPRRKTFRCKKCSKRFLKY